MSSILTHDRMKKSNFLRRFFNFFDIWPRAKCVLLALLHPWFPLSKAPLKIGRSWVQFLRMTESKNQIFAEDFNFFHIWRRAKFLGASPPRHPLEILAIENVMGWIQMINPRNLYLAISFNNRGESVADALGTLPRPRGPLFYFEWWWFISYCRSYSRGGSRNTVCDVSRSTIQTILWLLA